MDETRHVNARMNWSERAIDLNQTSFIYSPSLRQSNRLKDMTEQFDAKAAEIRAMFSNQLEPKRTAEIRERMLAAGLPI